MAADGTTRRRLETRGINVRWFSGTVLTGLCGAALMGGAVWAALENPTRPPAPAEVMRPQAQNLRPAADRPTNLQRKGDRLTPLTDLFSTSRQTIRVSQTVRVGDREIIRVRAHTRVVANLVQSSSGEYDIPTFNPLRLLAGDAPQRVVESEPDTDGEVTVISRDLSTINLSEQGLFALSTEEILDRVREVAFQPVPGLAGTAPDPQAAAPAEVEPEVREGRLPDDAPNVMRVGKREVRAADPARAPADRAAVAGAGDTVTSIVMGFGASREEARLIAMAFNRGGREITLREGQRVRVMFAQGAGGRLQPVRVIIMGDTAAEAAVALSDDGRYVAMDSPDDASATAEDDEEEDAGQGLRLYAALYETALRQEIPKAVIDEMIRLFGNDIDFSRRAGSNDLFELLYTADEEGDGARGDILYASLTSGGETRRYYRFSVPGENHFDYFDEQGRSVRKFLIRKPIAGGQMRSGFGMRRHPVMGYFKMHSGVDWSDRIGTPIVAAGNGVVSKASWSGGYGRRVEIEHANGYTTTYSHLSGFARGISEGSRVRQGQVIGYLGNSGLSTGPHLHYEVMVNGRFVDPLRVRVPRGREFDARTLTAFRAERERIDGLMTRDRAETRVTAQTQ
ncbi:M23 family metallopeptidase [Phreatobacter sp.]|uniref:M23 family metallopeptidase n=1 Tax=Phreatobacter sp. TaxID=1966341 RepID=UPI003F707349